MRLGSDYLHHTASAGPNAGEYFDPLQPNQGFLESRRIASDQWRVFSEPVHLQSNSTPLRVRHPERRIDDELACDPYTAWVVEPLIKEKRDIELIGEFVTAPKCDVEEVDRRVNEFGERGLVGATSVVTTSSANRARGRTPPVLSASNG